MRSPEEIMEQTRQNLHRSEDSVIDLDLAVWDGHVAMIVGNGMKAGRPLKGSFRAEDRAA
jgi:hypothetical protein